MRDRASSTSFLLGRKFVLITAVLLSIYIYGWSTKWTFDPVTSFGHPQDFFFTAQADSILRGRLWVDVASVGPATVDECFFVDGRCFGYFGIAPSLLRIPILLIFGTTTLSFTPLMIPLAAAIAFASALDLCRRQALRQLHGLTAHAFMVVVAAVLGPGSVLVLLADPYVYQEAILWAVAGVVLAINLFSRWYESRRSGHLFGAALACAFAAGSRPTAALVGPALALVIGFKYRKRLFKDTKALIGAGVLACLPLVLSAGIVYAKFGQLDFPANAYRNPAGGVREPFMGPCKFEFGPHAKMLPTNLFAYFRPDAVRIQPDVWPPITFRFGWCVGPSSPTYLWPLKGGPPGPLYVEKTTSLPNTMPIPLIATTCFLVFAVRRRLWVHVLVLASLGTMGLTAAATMGMTTRYLGDFYPLLAVGLAFSAAPLSQLSKHSTRIPAIAIISLLTAWSLAVNPSIFYWYARIYG